MYEVKGTMRKRIEILCAQELKFDIKVRIPANDTDDETDEIHRKGEFIVTYNNGTQGFLSRTVLERDWTNL